MKKKRHHWIVRVTHWVNVVAIVIMAGSGLRIFNAYPAFARKGEIFCCYPFEHKPIPAWLTFGGWLGGAAHWHFAMMWVLVVNGLIYLAFVYLHGEWRDLVPRKGDIRDSWQMVKFYTSGERTIRIRASTTRCRKRLTSCCRSPALSLCSPGSRSGSRCSCRALTALFGGYVWARYWHFIAMVVIVTSASSTSSWCLRSIRIRSRR